LEGIWNVNIQVNRTQWDAMNRSTQGTTDRDADDADRDSTNPQRDNDRGAQENREETDPQRIAEREALREAERRGTERDQEGDRTGSTTSSKTDSQMNSADGMARSNAILGGNILRTTVIFGADTQSTRSTTGRTPEQDGREADRNPQREGMSTTTAGQMDNSNLQSMSFLGYDQQSGEYNLALMTGHNGSIHYFTGKYDQSGRRVVFKSVDSSPVSTSTTDRTMSTSGAAMDGVTVVLQMNGNDSYSVTAYSGSAALGGSTGRDTDLGGQPSRDDNRDGNNPAQDRGAGDRQGREGGDASLAANIIYKATYTKADGTMRSQHDRMFDERERQERADRWETLDEDRGERTPR
jgi:hypothetical protein